MTAQTSIDAFAKYKDSGKLVSVKEEIMDAVSVAGRSGCIHDEISDRFPTDMYNGLHKRYSELERDCQIFRVEGDTRKASKTKNNQIVWRHHRYAEEFGVQMPTNPKKKMYADGIADGIRMSIKEVFSDLTPDSRRKLRDLYEAHVET